MMKRAIAVYTVILLCIGSLKITAQESNPFHDRAYWKTNPTISSVEAKIKKGASPTASNSHGFDAVCYAILEKASNETIIHLINKGNDVNKRTHDARTYIFWAAYKGNLELMKYLVANGAKTDIVDGTGYSLLLFAAVTGQTDKKIYEYCIAQGADVVNEVNKDGANALLLILPHLNDFDLVTYFTKKGLDLYGEDTLGNNAFNYAAKKANIPILEQLKKKGISHNGKNEEGGNAMIMASRTRRKANPLSFFKYLENLGVASNVTTNKGITPLHGLAYNAKDTAVFEYFVSKGVDVNQKDVNGNTALINAAYRNTLPVVTLLANKGKDVTITNNEGVSALARAVQRNTPEIVEFLLTAGANVNAVDKKGNTIGYYLIKSFSSKKENDFDKKVALLKKHGWNSQISEGNGSTLFHIAMEKHSIPLLKKIHAMGININTKDKNGNTALHLAAMKSKNPKILKYLMTIGADKKIVTEFNESVYDLATENELLKENNSSLNFLK
ncbi:ankyrin repeat domain-containing protein [Aquimarina hainanensis]|uniref:Ankyrin repeat domain-containing protein n=1 Tax=Aquimarina hainanensis TaxID=1578017 RepID=A0ABW5N7Q3_9FLAO